MKIYAAHGIQRLRHLLRLQGPRHQGVLRELSLHQSDVTFDSRTNAHGGAPERRRALERDAWWTPARDTMTGGRIKRVAEYVGREPFCCTYGDGVSDVNIRELFAFHSKEKTLATVTAVQPPGRFGVFTLTPARTACTASTRSRRATACGSTADSSFSSRRSSTTSRATTPCSSRNRYGAWPSRPALRL